MSRLKHNHGIVRVWRRNDEFHSHKRTEASFKSLDRCITVWRHASSFGVGRIDTLSGTVNVQVYLKLLQEVTIEEGARLIGDDFILQQDNASIHKAKSDVNYLKKKRCIVYIHRNDPPKFPISRPLRTCGLGLNYAYRKVK